MLIPITREEMESQGIERPDFVIVTGDAYVDHHSFGTAIIGRVLQSMGYSICILPRPRFTDCEDFKRFGRPRLGFLINSGVVDSMVNNYSVFKRRRKKDEYGPGGSRGGAFGDAGRPDRAVIVYSNRAREAYKDVPIIIGGIEASLRRFGHYDYWSDKVRRSILLDSRADLLIYGMGERAVVEIAEALDGGIPIEEIHWIRGSSYATSEKPIEDEETIFLPSFREIVEDKGAYAKSFAMQYRNTDYINGKTLVENYGNKWVVQNIPQEPLSTEELDHVYELPFENMEHPIYKDSGGIPAFREVRFSIVGCRGCYGGCSFCAITYHQGRQVRGRSKESLVKEAEGLTKLEGFKGYIHDVGGPTANFTKPACHHQLKHGVCKHRECLFPEPCKRLEVDHRGYIETLEEIKKLPKIKKVFIRSGIRYDYLLLDKKSDFLEVLCRDHVSGTLKVAPEHVCNNVLALMGKPNAEVFERFVREYNKTNKRLGKNQFLIPYLISSHPGSRLDDAIEMALYLKKFGFVPDQVQDFYPTPGTLATTMYYTGLHPFTMEEVHVAKDPREKQLQRALIHFNKRENRHLVLEALERADRQDLIPILLGENRRENGSNRPTRRGNKRGKRNGRKSHSPKIYKK